MCGNGCIRDVRNLKSGVSLEGLRQGDVVGYENTRGMVIEHYPEMSLTLAVRDEKNGIIHSRKLINYDENSGKFEHVSDIRTKLNSANLGSAVDYAMMEVGL